MICDKCGRQVDDGSAFCLYCGQRFGAAPAAPQQAYTAPAAPQQPYYQQPGYPQQPYAAPAPANNFFKNMLTMVLDYLKSLVSVNRKSPLVKNAGATWVPILGLNIFVFIFAFPAMIRTLIYAIAKRTVVWGGVLDASDYNDYLKDIIKEGVSEAMPFGRLLIVAFFVVTIFIAMYFLFTFLDLKVIRKKNVSFIDVMANLSLATLPITAVMLVGIFLGFIIGYLPVLLFNAMLIVTFILLAEQARKLGEFESIHGADVAAISGVTMINSMLLVTLAFIIFFRDIIDIF